MIMYLARYVWRSNLHVGSDGASLCNMHLTEREMCGTRSSYGYYGPVVDNFCYNGGSCINDSCVCEYPFSGPSCCSYNCESSHPYYLLDTPWLCTKFLLTIKEWVTSMGAAVDCRGVGAELSEWFLFTCFPSLSCCVHCLLPHVYSSMFIWLGSLKCQNGGRCQLGLYDNSEYCECPQGYSGLYCEQGVGCMVVEGLECLQQQCVHIHFAFSLTQHSHLHIFMHTLSHHTHTHSHTHTHTHTHTCMHTHTQPWRPVGGICAWIMGPVWMGPATAHLHTQEQTVHFAPVSVSLPNTLAYSYDD